MKKIAILLSLVVAVIGILACSFSGNLTDTSSALWNRPTNSGYYQGTGECGFFQNGSTQPTEMYRRNGGIIPDAYCFGETNQFTVSLLPTEISGETGTNFVTGDSWDFFTPTSEITETPPTDITSTEIPATETPTAEVTLTPTPTDSLIETPTPEIIPTEIAPTEITQIPTEITPLPKNNCNKGEGNGSEGCDPGNNPDKGNDDEDSSGGKKPKKK